MRSRARSGGDRRLAVVGALALYFALLAAGYQARVPHPWRLLGVAQLSPPFLDLHNVLSAVECERQGHDVLRANPCDAFGRPMNYPRAWLAVGALGVDGRLLVPAGIVLALAFFGTALAALGRTDRRGAAAAAALLCSPSVMLLVERGNVDIVLFVLCAAAAWLAARPRGTWASAAALGAGAALKVFPAFALPAHLLVAERPRRALGPAVAALAAFLALAWFTRDDLRVIAATVPRAAVLSYGANVARELLPGAPDLRPAFLLLALALAAAGARAQRLGTAAPVGGDAAGHAFATGALVYLGTFALGNNWAYRLAFLVLLLPQLSAWRRSGGGAARLASALLAAAVVAAWCTAGALDPFLPRAASRAVWGLGQAGSWVLASALSFQCGAMAAAAQARAVARPAAAPAPAASSN